MWAVLREVAWWRRTAFTLLFLGLLSSAALVSARHAPALPAEQSACGDADSRTLVEGKAARIYAVESEDSPPKVFGCLYGTGRPRRLRLPAEANGYPILREIGDVTLKAPWVAYSWLAVRYVDFVRTGVVVENLRTGKLSHASSALMEISGRVYGPGNVLRMVLKGNGSLAWIAEGESSPRYLQVVSNGLEGFKLLDEGSEIDPGSLSVEGSTISWVNAGLAHSVILR